MEKVYFVIIHVFAQISAVKFTYDVTKWGCDDFQNESKMVNKITSTFQRENVIVVSREVCNKQAGVTGGYLPKSAKFP